MRQTCTKYALRSWTATIDLKRRLQSPAILFFHHREQLIHYLGKAKTEANDQQERTQAIARDACERCVAIRIAPNSPVYSNAVINDATVLLLTVLRNWLKNFSSNIIVLIIPLNILKMLRFHPIQNISTDLVIWEISKTYQKEKGGRRWIDDITAYICKTWARLAKDRKTWKDHEEGFIQHWIDTS